MRESEKGKLARFTTHGVSSLLFPDFLSSFRRQVAYQMRQRIRILMTSPLPFKNKHIVSPGRLLAALALLMSIPAKADLLELTNGDHYRGTVISMTLTSLEFQSEIQGRVKLPRDKVAQITFHESMVPKPTVTVTPPSSAAPLLLSGTGTAPSSQADAVVKQMRRQGIDPKLINQVQEQIFGKASPEAAQKFNETMDGLISGKLSIQDIRVQAQNSIGQIRAARKELGDDAGDMLDGYLAILEKFVAETGPSTSAPTLPQPAPTTPTVPVK
jgi:hypothetical protein